MGSQRIDPTVVSTNTQQQQPWISQYQNLINGLQPTSTQNQALGQLGSYLSPTSTETAGTNLINNTLNGNYLNAGSNPYLQGQVSAAIQPVQDWYTDQSKDLASKANLMGLSSGTPKLDQQVQLANQAGQKISDITSKMYGNAYDSERQLQQSALNSGLNYSGAGLSRLSNVMQLAGLPNTYSQQQMSGLASLLGLTQGQLSTPTYAPSDGSQALSGLGSLAGSLLGAGTSGGGSVLASLLGL